MDTKQKTKHILRTRDKNGKVLQETILHSGNTPMKPAERKQSHSAGETASEPGQRAPPVNPWSRRAPEVQEVVDLGSCLNLDKNDFPPLQRGTMNQPKKEGQEDKKQQIRSKISAAAKVSCVFGLTVLPKQTVIQTKAQSVMKKEAQTAVSLVSPSVRQEAEATGSTAVSAQQSAKVPVPTPPKTAHLGAPTTPPNAKPAITILKRPASTAEVRPTPTAEVRPTPPNAEPAITILKRPASKVPHEMTPKSQAEITPLELHQLMAEKDYKVSLLEREKLVLVNELEQLKRQLKLQKREANQEIGELFIETYRKGKIVRDATLNAQKLEEALKIETNIKMEAEKRLAMQEEETSTVKMELDKVKSDLEKSRCQWEEERSCLLAAQVEKISTLKGRFLQELEKKTSEWKEDRSRLMDDHVKQTSYLKTAFLQELEKKRSEWEEDRSHLLEEQIRTTSSLKKMLMQVQEDLDKERQQWQDEKSSLLESLNVFKQALKDQKQKRETSTDGLVNRVTELENLMEEVQRRPKKKSIKKRFLQFFGRK
ncbi:proteoglycan 4-like [Lates japonicus]